MTHEEKAEVENILRSMYSMKAGVMTQNDKGENIYYPVHFDAVDQVEKILAQLPPVLSETLRLIYCEGATEEDVSRLTGDILFRVKNNRYMGLLSFWEHWKQREGHYWSKSGNAAL